MLSSLQDYIDQAKEKNVLIVLHQMGNHGLPYLIAPEEQKHVGAILWFGDNYNIDRAKLQEKRDGFFSHDNLFHTLLGAMEIETEVYDESLDILSGVHTLHS